MVKDERHRKPAVFASIVSYKALAVQLTQRDTAAEFDPLAGSVDKYVGAARADNTLLAYGKQWAAFVEWCTTKDLCELPAAPDTVALYLAACADAGLAVATLAQAKAVLTRRHEDAGHTSPCASPLVKQAWAGVVSREIAPLEHRALS